MKARLSLHPLSVENARGSRAAGPLGYSIVGLVHFAGLTTFDFQRLRQSTDLDVLNVFLFFLQLFTRNDQS